MTITENYMGSNCTGSDGASSRTLILANNRITLANGLEVFINGVFLHLTADFTISHNNQYSVITFVNAVFDDMYISVNYEISQGGVPGTGASGIIPLDTQQFINEIDYYGDTITLTVLSGKTYSAWGDQTATETDTNNIKCIVNDLTAEEQKVSESNFINADKKFFFKSTQGSIVNGNRITFNSVVYTIVRVFRHTSIGNTYMVEAWGKAV